MSNINEVYNDIAKLNLWFKTRSGDPLTMTDLPEFIPLRWAYIRDNWQFLRQGAIESIQSYFNPDFLNEQIKDFTAFVDSQKTVSKKINPFSDRAILYKFYAVFDNILVENIPLTNEEEKIIADKINLVKQYSKNDFLDIKKSLTKYRDRYADNVQLSDENYNKAHDRSSIAGNLRVTITDVNMMATIQKAIKSVDFVLANLFAVDASVDPFALARANANNPEINIGQYSSGTLVKLHYGESLQELATRYFGDPNKWIDIAIANGLKPPYIDEVGLRLSLLSNADGNQININQTDPSGNLNIDRFYINQAVLLQSNTQVFPEQRTIVNIKQIPVSGEIVIELDGDPNLDRYKVSENAHIRVYKPNTVNSAFFVLIPSEERLPDDRKEEVPWFLAKSPEAEKRAKIDFAVDDNGEINFGTNGDIKLSFGLANAVQAIRLKMMTELGTLKHHLNYGLVSITGSKNNDLESVKAILSESITTQIEADTRFDRVENISVDYVATDLTNNAASALVVSLAVRLAGSEQVIPISFTVSQ